ncbi:hypothetical protein HY091_03140 [Candidatus Kaiserbacteria bacterium]|nr:hypothetical protein [Candidatus Kaiserbacteria bacterium]
MTNNTVTNIETNVMRRIYIIAALRPILSGAVVATVLALLALWGIGREVWVAKVFANGPQDFVGHSLYLLYAFEHTRLVVQALSLITLGALIYLARETARLISTTFSPVHA